MSAKSTVLAAVKTAVEGLAAFRGVPVSLSTDLGELHRGERGAACFLQATERRISPNHDYYEVALTIAVETVATPQDDQDGSRLVELSDAVADWLHTFSGRAAVDLGFDGLLPGQTEEPPPDGARQQIQHPCRVFITYTPTQET